MAKWNILTAKERYKCFTTRPARALGVPEDTNKPGCRTRIEGNYSIKVAKCLNIPG